MYRVNIYRILGVGPGVRIYRTENAFFVNKGFPFLVITDIFLFWCFLLTAGLSLVLYSLFRIFRRQFQGSKNIEYQENMCRPR